MCALLNLALFPSLAFRQNNLNIFGECLAVDRQGGQWFFPKKLEDFSRNFQRFFFKSQGHEKTFGGLLNKCFKKTLDNNWT